MLSQHKKHFSWRNSCRRPRHRTIFIGGGSTTQRRYRVLLHTAGCHCRGPRSLGPRTTISYRKQRHPAASKEYKSSRGLLIVHTNGLLSQRAKHHPSGIGFPTHAVPYNPRNYPLAAATKASSQTATSPDPTSLICAVTTLENTGFSRISQGGWGWMGWSM